MSTHRFGLIDTNIVLLRSPIDPVELPTDEMFISAVTMAELEIGPHFAEDPAEKERRVRGLRKVQAAFQPIPFDAAAASATATSSELLSPPAGGTTGARTT